MYIKSFCLGSICYLTMASLIHAGPANNASQHPFYFGATAGYGQTTWQGLVPPKHKQNIAMAISTPKEVDEGGTVWGLFAGYEFFPAFAVEAAYMHYPDAEVSFDDLSIFAYEHDGRTQFTTKAETISLMAKIMLPISSTNFRVYSSLGFAEMHRSDEVKTNWMASPTFGGGVNYDFSDHIMGEFGANYTAGKGQSELTPELDYFPFVYSIFFRLAYRI